MASATPDADEKAPSVPDAYHTGDTPVSIDEAACTRALWKIDLFFMPVMMIGTSVTLPLEASTG